MDDIKFKKMLDEQSKELKSDYARQGKFLLEQFEKKTSFIAEQYGDLNKKISKISDKLDATFEMTGKLTVEMSFVKDELKNIKNELKVKVNKDEFNILEKRVFVLEKKVI